MIKASLALLNLITIALMFVSAASAYINPNSVWYFSFAGILFMPLMFVNFAFLVFWMSFRKLFALIPVLGLLFCLKSVRLSFGFNVKSSEEKGVKMMLWNVKNFDLYNWSKNMETRKEMMELIGAENPDILCFQEFYSDNGVLMNNVKYLTDTLGYKYYHFEPTVDLNRTHNKKPIHQTWGEATFSKYPIVNKYRVDFANSRNNDCIYSDLLIEKDTLRVYNMHLQSIHLDEGDYFAIQTMEEKQEASWFSIRRIIKKMKTGYRSRASQAELVAKNVRKYSGNQLICGDMNDVPISYSYYKLANANTLQDAFVEKGFGFGKSFINKYLYFRIDHVLASKSIEINSYKTVKKVLSDHYPICVTFNIRSL